MPQNISVTLHCLKGSLIRNFRPQVFFVNHFQLAPEHSLGTILIFTKIRGYIRKEVFLYIFGDAVGLLFSLMHVLLALHVMIFTKCSLSSPLSWLPAIN
jgi:hypothetical protein